MLELIDDWPQEADLGIASLRGFLSVARREVRQHVGVKRWQQTPADHDHNALPSISPLYRWLRNSSPRLAVVSQSGPKLLAPTPEVFEDFHLF